MTTDFMLTLAKLLEHCPKCHKTTLNEFSRLDISSSKMSRTCQCGYSIEINIKENTINPEEQRKILLENLENIEVKENKIENVSQLINVHKPTPTAEVASIKQEETKQQISNVVKQDTMPPTVAIETKNENDVQKVQQLGKDLVNKFNNNSNNKKDFSFKNFNNNFNRR